MRVYKTVGYTKRHMEDLARILKETREEITNIPKKDLTPELAIDLIQSKIEELLFQNPRFNLDKFRRASK